MNKKKNQTLIIFKIFDLRGLQINNNFLKGINMINHKRTFCQTMRIESLFKMQFDGHTLRHTQLLQLQPQRNGAFLSQ